MNAKNRKHSANSERRTPPLAFLQALQQALVEKGFLENGAIRQKAFETQWKAHGAIKARPPSRTTVNKLKKPQENQAFAVSTLDGFSHILLGCSYQEAVTPYLNTKPPSTPCIPAPFFAPKPPPTIQLPEEEPKEMFVPVWFESAYFAERGLKKIYPQVVNLRLMLMILEQAQTEAWFFEPPRTTVLSLANSFNNPASGTNALRRLERMYFLRYYNVSTTPLTPPRENDKKCFLGSLKELLTFEKAWPPYAEKCDYRVKMEARISLSPFRMSGFVKDPTGLDPSGFFMPLMAESSQTLAVECSIIQGSLGKSYGEDLLEDFNQGLTLDEFREQFPELVKEAEEMD